MGKEKKSIRELYDAFVSKFIKKAQEDNSIPGYYSYVFKGHGWLLTRPRSVMDQKKAIGIMRKHLSDEFDFESELEFLKVACENAQKDKQAVQLNELEYDELELLKKNYIDWILLPLYLSGTRAIEEYMEQKLKQTESSSK